MTKIKRQENNWNNTIAFVVFFMFSVAKMFTTNFCELFHDNILRELYASFYIVIFKID